MHIAHPSFDPRGLLDRIHHLKDDVAGYRHRLAALTAELRSSVSKDAYAAAQKAIAELHGRIAELTATVAELRRQLEAARQAMAWKLGYSVCIETAPPPG